MKWHVLALAVAVIALAGCAGLGGLGGEPEVLWSVNCGAEQDYVDQAGKVWLADRELAEGAEWGAVGGLTVERWGLDVTGTEAPDVYLFERYSMTAYEFSVPNETYSLKLHFAETYEGIAYEDERVFSVLVNGKEVLTDFDPFAEAGGFAKPVVADVAPFEVTGGKITIEFEPNIQSPEINGIEVIMH